MESNPSAKSGESEKYPTAEPVSPHRRSVAGISLLLGLASILIGFSAVQNIKNISDFLEDSSDAAAYGQLRYAYFALFMAILGFVGAILIGRHKRLGLNLGLIVCGYGLATNFAVSVINLTATPCLAFLIVECVVLYLLWRYRTHYPEREYFS